MYYCECIILIYLNNLTICIVFIKSFLCCIRFHMKNNSKPMKVVIQIGHGGFDRARLL